MTTLNPVEQTAAVANPVDHAENIASHNDWVFERVTEDELTLFLEGAYTDLQLRVFWRDSFKTLQFACLFDMKVSSAKQDDIYRLLGLINERMWIGHFEYWREEGVLLFRHASLAEDPFSSNLSEDHIATVMETAINECERFYPVFQFVLWGGQTAEQAIESAMLECEGSA